MPWVKICGMTREQDVSEALRLGARFVGCIVGIARSPRCVSDERAQELAAVSGGRMVFVVEDRDAMELAELATRAQVAAVQLHGSETPDYVADLKRLRPELQVWKVMGVPEDNGCVEALLATAREFLEAGCDAILLDAQVRGVSGGTGKTCDWETARAVVDALAGDVILAGGLGPQNVAEAARIVAPAGLDLSSGVESSPGVKSFEKLQRLFRALSDG